MGMTAEQLEARRSGIGGSDAGAVLGLSPYRTPVDVYLEKIGQAQPDMADNDATYWGNVLEETIAAEYSRRTGNKVMRRPQQFTSSDHDFMLANIDRWVVGKKRVLECKTAGQYMSDQWGPSGTDQVPDSYLAQVTHYMVVMGVEVADLAVLIGGRDFRMYTIGLDRELADIVIEREHDFWFNHVKQGIPPEPTTLHDLTELYPADDGQQIVASADIETKVATLKTLKAQGKEIEKLIDDYSLEVKKAIGGGSVLLNGEGNVIATWKKAKDSTRFDKKACAKDHPEIIEQYSVVTPGSRRFLIK